jgi:APA family basic amino acid/polyamine antiporter
MAGAVNSYLLTGPRIARLLAEERLAAPAFGHLTASGVPAFATLWIAAVSLVLVFTNTFNELLDLTVPIIWVTNLAVAAGLLVQRRRVPDRPRPFRVPGAAWVVGAQFLVGLTCLGSLIVHLVKTDRTRVIAIDAAGLAIGAAIYKWIAARQRARDSSNFR